MKKVFLLIMLSLFGSGQTRNQDAINGFKNYVFGVSPGVYKNLVLEIEEGTTTLYSLNQPVILIDGIEFEYLRVTFHKNKLSAISVKNEKLKRQGISSILNCEIRDT